MKCLILVAPEPAREAIVDFLSSRGLDWFTITAAEGHGPGLAAEKQSAHDDVLGYVGALRLEVLLSDDEVTPLLTELAEAVGAQTRRLVRHWVVPVESAGHL